MTKDYPTRVRRWAAVDKRGNVLGVGISAKQRFEEHRIVFREGSRGDWELDGRRYARLMDGNFARLIRAGWPHNISEYKHGRIRRKRSLKLFGKRSKRT